MRMPSTFLSQTPAKRPRAGRAFTLVEVVAVMLVAAIVAAVAIPTMSSLSSTRAAAAARQVVRDLSYARERAIDTGCRVWTVFNAASNSYSLLAEPPGSPGRSNAIAMTDAATQASYVQSFNSSDFAGVSLLSAGFDSGSEVGFDWNGKSLNNTGAPLASNGTVSLSGSKTITVRPTTGLASTP
jgi:prepilin-type N-terminal cleavage/methylation domain-containing protein